MGYLQNEDYQPGNALLWQGRTDGSDDAYLRWHQVVQCIDLSGEVKLSPGSYVLLGFCSDEGVRRNSGRVGAAQGPKSIREVLRNLPVHHDAEVTVYDGGDILCTAGNLERAQQQLSLVIRQVLELGCFAIVLGGGHEVTYAHFQGVSQSVGKLKEIGIINFDAHFDLREPVDGIATSGTGFFQIAEDLHKQGKQLHYLALGIQKISNTKVLFETANEFGATYITADEMGNSFQQEHILLQLEQFIAKVDCIYMTIDLDVFAAAYAPGVSATAFCGILPDQHFFKLFNTILNSGKLRSYDIAELNPVFDVDNRTAKLAADLIFKSVSG
ncbi:formimidoylglutamase [Sphingobacterium spiritivorum]|uniref:formimidoylglutamase n=1 Tax=Sphingobacterium spiritivorum TaxID=258 RepID=UPI001919599F|nr:formimidoylglutamase [Sphingobacterium spiritivorum]QQT27210.1 formimidoylglutamase [Sphingobacterium spiritivorum]